MHRDTITPKINRLLINWVVVFVAAIPLQLAAQHSPGVQWIEFFSDQADHAYDFAQKENGHLIVAATSTNWNTVESQIMLFEADLAGREVWRKYIGGPHSIVRKIFRHIDGGFLLFGLITSPNDQWQMAKVDSLGELEWAKSVPGVRDGRFGLVLSSSDRIVFGTGIQTIPDSQTVVPALVYVTQNGDSLFTKTFETEARFSIGAMAVSSINGGIVVTGFKSTPLGDRQGHILKVDESGEREWSLTFGGEYIEQVNGIIEDPEGNYVVTGVGHTATGGADLYAAKISATGKLVWELYAGGQDRDIGNALALDRDGGYIFTGLSNTFETNDNHLYIVKADSSGVKKWEIISDVPKSEGNAIQVDEEGNYIIAGWSEGPEDPSDAFVVKYGAGTILGQESHAQANGKSLHVFPNPSSRYFVLDYELDTPGLKRLELFDVHGRSVKKWSKQFGASGRTQVDLGDSVLGTGVYLLRVSGENLQVSIPVTVISSR